MNKVEKGQYGEPLEVLLDVGGFIFVTSHEQDLDYQEMCRARDCVNILDGWDIEEVKEILEMAEAIKQEALEDPREWSGAKIGYYRGRGMTS